jgi:hypothetical protein
MKCLSSGVRALLGVLVLGSLAASSAAAQQKDVPAPSPEEAAMMDAMMKYATPGPEHQKLAKMAGTWKAVSQSYMMPGEKPTEGETVAQSILGGRYLSDHLRGSWNGMPFEGHGITGYDNYKKEYFTVWFDNFGTGVLLGTGNFDAGGKVLTMHATYDDPMTGKKTKTRMVTTLVSDDKHLWEMFTTQDGKEQKVMDITYTRK